jgi:hypothetical protein
MAAASHRKSPEICPACGSNVPPDSRACPECGADEETGWNEKASIYDNTDLPDPGFNYDEFLQTEFPDGKKSGRFPNKTATALILLTVLLLAVISFLIRRGT